MSGGDHLTHRRLRVTAEPDPVPDGTRLDAALRLMDDGLRTGAGRRQVRPSGLTPLDTHLGGGLHPGDLVVLGGAPGTGKTALALQVARNVCAAGGDVVYVCFEHTTAELTERLVVLEVGLSGAVAGAGREEVRLRLLEPDARAGLEPALAGLPGGREAYARLASYAPRMHLVGARGHDLAVPALAQAAGRAGAGPVVVVDQLHHLRSDDDATRTSTSRAAAGLKDLALELGGAVVAVSALSAEGLSARRVRTRHLLGSEVLAYEADVVLLLQDKLDLVSRERLLHDPTASLEHHRWLVCSIEKNRRGPDRLDLEFRKRFTHGHVEPAGRVVTDDLVDERTRGV